MSWIEVGLPAGWPGGDLPHGLGVVDIARIYAVSPWPRDWTDPDKQTDEQDRCAIWVEGIGMMQVTKPYEEVRDLVIQERLTTYGMRLLGGQS